MNKCEDNITFSTVAYQCTIQNIVHVIPIMHKPSVILYACTVRLLWKLDRNAKREISREEALYRRT